MAGKWPKIWQGLLLAPKIEWRLIPILYPIKNLAGLMCSWLWKRGEPRAVDEYDAQIFPTLGKRMCKGSFEITQTKVWQNKGELDNLIFHLSWCGPANIREKVNWWLREKRLSNPNSHGNILRASGHRSHLLIGPSHLKHKMVLKKQKPFSWSSFNPFCCKC